MEVPDLSGIQAIWSCWRIPRPHSPSYEDGAITVQPQQHKNKMHFICWIRTNVFRISPNALTTKLIARYGGQINVAVSIFKWCSRRDSNSERRIRSPTVYPVSLRKRFAWGDMRDSNPRHNESQSPVLPTELMPPSKQKKTPAVFRYF